jgi:tetratricopeptide (TPR) repeat protein
MLHAQQINVDSLWQASHNFQSPDSNRLDALIRYGLYSHLKSQPDSAIYYADLALAEAIPKNLRLQQARALTLKGTAQFNLGEYRKAISYHNESLAIFSELLYMKGIGNCYNNLGNSYLRLGETIKAMKLYEKSLDIWISTGDKLSGSTSLYNLGSIYMTFGEDARAIEAFTHALLVREELDDQLGVASAHNNIGVLYNSQGDAKRALAHFRASLEIRKRKGEVKGQASSTLGIGTVYTTLHRLDSALTFYFRALNLYRQVSSLDNIAQTQEKIAEAYEMKGDFEQAKAYCDSALQNYTHTENAEGLAMVLNRAGEINLKLHKPSEAIAAMNLSLEIAQSIESVPNIRDAAYSLYKVYKESGQDRKALEMHELYLVMRDSVASEENQQSIIRNELKYEFEKEKLVKAQEQAVADRIAKERSTRRDRLQYGLITGFVIFLLLGLFTLGFVRVPKKVAFIGVFLALLVVFEFLLVLIDPYTDPISQGQPIIKFLINIGLAILLAPLQAFLEGRVQVSLLKSARRRAERGLANEVAILPQEQ